MSTYDIAVIGAGYVGMPHAQTFAEAGKKVVIVDILQDVVDAINRGESHIQDVPSEKLAPHVGSGAIVATTDFAACADAAAIRRAACPSPYSSSRVAGISAVRTASASRSGSSSTRTFAPASTVSTHSVDGRAVTQGMPFQ